MSLRDRINQMTGKTRYVVSRIFIQLCGDEVVPLIGILNQAGRNAIDSKGDMKVLGEGLVDICQNLLTLKYYWQSAGNEGDVFWQEEEAGDYVTELFTDCAQRYGSGVELSQQVGENEPLTLPITQNLVVMITVAFEGENPDLETNLADQQALEYGLKALINLHYQGKLQAIQVHFSPAQLGEQLTTDQLLVNYPELLPL
jgi:hypothetical protein